MKQQGLKLKLQKCQFLKEETKYLRFAINKIGVKPDLDKVNVIMSMPESKSVKELRRFIRDMGYYRGFITGFSRIAIPLINLIKSTPDFDGRRTVSHSLTL